MWTVQSSYNARKITSPPFCFDFLLLLYFLLGFLLESWNGFYFNIIIFKDFLLSMWRDQLQLWPFQKWLAPSQWRVCSALPPLRVLFSTSWQFTETPAWMNEFTLVLPSILSFLEDVKIEARWYFRAWVLWSSFVVESFCRLKLWTFYFSCKYLPPHSILEISGFDMCLWFVSTVLWFFLLPKQSLNYWVRDSRFLPFLFFCLSF
mgnify:CR=1 FL=1